MANLSNINNYFVVDTTGKVAIGDVSAANIPTLLTQLTLYDNTATASLVIQSGAASGKKYELGSSSTGKFQITDLDASLDRLTIDTAGNVGIGTTAPLSKLTVSEGTNQHGIELAPGTLSYLQCYDRATSTYGNMTIDAKYLAFGLNNGAEKIRFTADGNVGIGTTTPTQSKLVISGGATGTLGGGDAGITMINKFDNPDNSWSILPQITGVANTGLCIRDNTDSADRLVIDGLGKVGIGTNSPKTNLEVIGGLNISTNTTSATTTTMRIGSYGASSQTYYGAKIVAHTNFTSTANTDLSFDLGGLGEVMRLHSSGSEKRVGIGTTVPSYKLEVNGGTALVGGGFYVSNDQTILTSSTYTFRDAVYINNPNSTSAAVSANSVMSIGASSGNSVDTSLITTGAIGIGATAPTAKLYLNDAVGNGTSMWTFAPSGQYAYTGHKCWNAITGTATNNGYYKIGTIEDSRSAIINIKTAAHSTATILVSRGYGPSAVSRFQILSSTRNANGNYANIVGVRIAGGGGVDIQLSWSSGPNVQIEITIYGNGFTIPNTLVPSVSTVGGTYPNNVLQTTSLGGPAASAYVSGLLQVGSGIASPATFGTTTGSAANMVVDVNGTFFRSTSSLKYKKEVRDYDKGLNEVMQLQPKYYKGEDDGDIQFAGLIAEDVHDLGLTEFVQYAEDDSPDALAYPNMIALLTKAIQELKTEIDELKK